MKTVCSTMLAQMDTFVSSKGAAGINGTDFLTDPCLDHPTDTLNLLLPYTRLTTLLHQNSSGNTPLHWAGLNGHLATVKALVAKIEEAEQADPSEAEAIRAVNRRRDAEARENKKRKQAEEEEKRKRESAAADGAESQESTSASTAAAETNHEDSEADRSIWDIRNKFGRGPTSESQLNDQEAVVQYLLTAMAGGGGEAGKAGQGSSSISASASTEEITQKAEQLKVEEKS